MKPRRTLPAALGGTFSVRVARDAGVSVRRLRGDDLEQPFHGVRRRVSGREQVPDAESRLELHEREARAIVGLAHAYTHRMSPREFFTHTTAALLWGAPLGKVDGAGIHVGTFQPHRGSRAQGVVGHELRPGLAEITTVHGLAVTTPATSWAMLGALPIDELVVVGDFFAREWRRGFQRPHAGRPALATRGELERMLAAGRRRGANRLREALKLIREDSWSPMETRLRLLLVRAGLPEPELNVDLYDDFGGFLGCVDLCYPTERVVVEYQGMLHGAQYARDIERVEAMRAAGRTVIQVSWPLLFRRPGTIIRRVARALHL